MIYLLLMAVAGSLLLPGFLLWQRLFDRWLTENIKYRAILSVLLVYMVPWVWMRPPYEMLFGMVSRREAAIAAGTAGTGCGAAYTFLQEWYGMPAKMCGAAEGKWFLLAGIVWSSGSVVLMAAKLLVYIYERNLLWSVAEEWGKETLTDVTAVLREELECVDRVRIYRIPGERISFAAGWLRPVIFLQETSTDREQELILRHELIHVVRRDALLRWLSEWICCLYWWNPLIYVWKNYYLEFRESSCDERVVKGCTKEERAVYARLITESMREQRRKYRLYSGLGNDYKRTRRRIELIMREKKINRTGKWMAVSCFVLLVMLNSLTAFLYPGLR